MLIYANSSSSLSDLALRVFEQNNATAIRRVYKSDNNPIALAVGATVVNRIEDTTESDVGSECALPRQEKH